ncbi:MAG TPA: DVU0150 family protein [Syntrophobacteraceae bacterium]|nr:DVU0150 family protein [Syntrophobacteraceae bacterium]
MRKIFKRLCFFSLILLLLPHLVCAAGGGEVAPMVLVADTRKLNGFVAFWANIYNESHMEFTLLTVITIVLVGAILGLTADAVMNWVGIDLKHRDLVEH